MKIVRLHDYSHVFNDENNQMKWFRTYFSHFCLYSISIKFCFDFAETTNYYQTRAPDKE